MKTEDFLQEHKYYKTLIQSATEYVVAVNRKYQVIMANDLFKNEFGMQPNDYCYKVWKKKKTRMTKLKIYQLYQYLYLYF